MLATGAKDQGITLPDCVVRTTIGVWAGRAVGAAGATAAGDELMTLAPGGAVWPG